jgi:hypothetical protein
MAAQYPTMTGMLKLTASETGWIEAVDGPVCWSCGVPAKLYQPLLTGTMAGHIKMIWWCQPCETTWEV